MRKLVIFNPFHRVICITLLSLIINVGLIAQCPNGTIEGNVFLDYNFNGVRDAGEEGESGIFVRVYNTSGTTVAQSLTDATGAYTVQGLNNGQDYMFEFVVPDSHRLSATGPDKNTDILSLTAPACNVNIGILDSATDCNSNTEIILSCFANGVSGDNPGQETLIGITHSFNASSKATVYATKEETGAVWGMAYNANTNTVYSAAFIKQHSGLTAHGHDAIFATTLGSTPSTSLFVKLSDLGQEVGTLTETLATTCNYGKQVGKIGLGGMTLDDDSKYLYVTNIYNNTIVKIDTENPTAETTETFTVPNPGCSMNDYRAFALTFHNGKVYVGVTCTAETTLDEDDTSIHVYSLNSVSGNFTLEFSTDYSRGVWVATNSERNIVMQWLTDIAFTDEGNMIISLSDRKGHSYCQGTTSRVDEQKGDILLVENIGGTWVLENNGKTSTLTGTGVGNGDGPGGGEFFGYDFFPQAEDIHPEVALGSVVTIPGTGEVVAAVFDPIVNSYSGGLHRYNTSTGGKTGSKELYNSNITTYFGKATGFGDLTARCGALPAEVGNLVWLDANCDGIQNAGEEGITNLVLNIYNSTCELVGTSFTDESGRYVFNSSNVDTNGDGNMDGLTVGAKYYVTLAGNTYDQTTGAFLIDNNYYYPTTSNIQEKWNSNLQTNTAACVNDLLNGTPVVEVIAESGNSATFDLGLCAATDFDLALTKEITSGFNVKLGDIIDFEITVYNQGDRIATEFGIVDYMTPAYTFDATLNEGWVEENGMLRKTVTENLLAGQTHTESLRLTFVGSDNIEDFTNYAEISYARDINGEMATDIDSQYDSNKYNDNGGEADGPTDGLITDDGTIDEDDHDPARLQVLDLALKNVIRDERLYDIDEYAVFDMTVYNQGNVTVTSFDITNKFSECMDFALVDNETWVTTIPEFVKTTVNETILPGENITISLKLKLNAHCDYYDIVNIAEISAFTAINPAITVDMDSEADDFLFNDAGGSPYDYTDNLLTGNGIDDEDDHDPAVLAVRRIDLALMKTTESAIYEHGDIVPFEIKIYNQGDVPVGTVVLVDYLPEHTKLVSTDWTQDPNDPTGKTVFKAINFPNGFNPGEEHTETLTLRIQDSAPTGAFLINEAEIGAVSDMLGIDISDNDIDSSADMDANNDMGGNFMTVTDDNITDNGTMDEDDHDPSGFLIADLSISRACECLNMATEPHNGLFQTEIVIRSISGQTWYLDDYVNVYNNSSTPDNLMTLFGYTLSETVVEPGISEYTFTGVFVDGQRYEVRFTNGFGTYLNASGGGPNCSYNRPVINSENGLSAVCTGSVHSYSVSDLLGCTNYEWTLSGGGSIIGSNTNQTVTVQWSNTEGGPYTLQLTPLCGMYCLAPVVEDITIGNGGGVMSCHGNVNVSLNNNCTADVDADLFLTTPPPPGVAYQLMLTDDHGRLIPNNHITEEYLWETLTAKVIDPCSGNSCWSMLAVEDKMAPEIYCGDIVLPCYLMNTYEPIVIDNCTDATYDLISETIRPLDCDPLYIKEVVRTYVSIDGYGNRSRPCEQVIQLERIDYDNIVPPQDFLLQNNTNLTCVDSIYNENGEIDVKIVGSPTLHGFSIWPIQDLYCNVAIEYDDFLVADFGCVRKIMRTWRIYEDWCTIGETWTWVQTIEIADTNAPEIECPDDITVSSGGGPDCERTFQLDLPTIIDDCTSEYVIDLSYVGGFQADVQEAPFVTIPSGTYDVVYNVYDLCENLSSCEVSVTVLDERPPVAVCDENTVVSLRSDGTAKAFAETFDDGSYDDCSLFNFLVKRVETTCDCKYPVFDDMHYLGERDGRFYYLSKFLTHGSKAFLYSEAYGGMLLTLESEGEADWVFDRTREFISSPYYIGLSDFDHPGRFTWSNHADPTFDHWADYNPVDVGDHVITNSDGEWVVVDGNDVEAYYVLELSDPCGYSDEVRFCCEDAGSEHMVVFRAIDYFGKVNECMVNVEVQDKVAPKITCPPSLEIDCDRAINLDDLSEFGTATASDQCSFEIREELIDLRNNCGFGDLVRRFYAEDRNGFSTCDQVLRISQTSRFDFNTIIWPEDFYTELGCDSGELHPDSLALEFSRPRYTTNACSQVAATYKDQTYDFSGATGSDACLKILRRWTVIDWCQMDDPDYEPASYDQTIKVSNLVGPQIRTGCDSLVINTFACDFEDVVFTAVAHDDCTPDEDLRGRILIDLDSDGFGTYDIEENFYSNVVSFDGELPVGKHFALISFTDQCNNTTTCTKIIEINNVKGPTAACIDGLSVALEPMDLDSDGDFDTEMACIRPWMLDASSTHDCDVDFVLAFSADPTDTIRCFECVDIGENTVQLWAIDIFGNTDYCEATIDVQDNNDQDFCPRFDLALIKSLDTVSTPGPFMQGSDVRFNITVINQGNMEAYNVELVDYIPDGLVLNDSDWTANGDMATYNTPIEFIEDSTSTTVSIDFTIDENFMGLSLTNTAEIKNADGDDNPGNEAPIDSDSTPDMINDDIVGGDDEINNDNNDEDDHDIAVIEVVQIFDLALDKDCAEQSDPFMPGSEVEFTLTVTNEGTLDAYNVQIADYIPAGLMLSDSDWTANAGVATLNTPIPFIARASSETVTITFVVESDFMGTSITNVAEIIDPDNEFPVDDIDSDPGNDDGDQSEDDEDSKTISVGQVFDLALTKIVDTNATPDPINVGDDVTFIVTVYNQGSLDATSVRVTDYIPAGFTYDPLKNSDFGLSGSNATATVPFLPIDSSVELELVLTLDTDLPSPMIVNNAEITAADNALGLEDQDDPLSNTNDGSTNELATDNDIDDERDSAPGTMDNPNDEDDYDPALVEVFCPPTADCQSNVTIELDASGTATITTDIIDNGSFDNCNQDIDLSLDQSSFDCDDLGQTTVTLTITVGSGLSDSCEASVTIVDDTVPVAECQDITVELDSNGEATIVTADIDNNSFDACNDLDYELDITDFDCDDLFENNPVVLTVSDGTGNSDTCEANVTVVDNEDPEVFCVNALIADLNESGEASFTVGEYIQSSSDNCGIVEMNATQFDFVCDDISDSPITVTVTVEDESGNTADCTVIVMVEDNLAPECTLDVPGPDIGAETVITLDVLGFDADDNCTATVDIMTEITPLMFDCDDVGNMETVTVTVTDEEGNSSTCSTTVTIVDNTDPVCVSQDITISLDAGGMASITAMDVDGGSTAGCDENPILTVDPSQFDCSDVGVNMVTLTVTASGGASDECTANVTVEDDMPPVIECVDDFTLSLEDGMVMITAMDILESQNDNCGINSMTIDISVFDCDDDGETITVTAIVIDANMNTSTCTTDVTLDDDQAPTCTLVDITVNPVTVITIEDIVSNINTYFDDNCADDAATVTISEVEFDCTDIGDNPITVTVTDGSGNSGTCTATVTVEDMGPMCMAQDITIFLDANGEYNLTAAEVDNGSTGGCAEPFTLSIVPTFFGCNDVDVSPVQVTLTVTDANDVSDQCTSQVTVIDNIDPDVECEDAIEVTLDSNGEATITAADVIISVFDGCGVDSQVLDIDMFDCSDKMTTVNVTLTVTDDNMNTTTCVTEVTVVDDEAPVCTVAADLTFSPEVTIDPADVLGTFSDNCATASVSTTLDPDMFTCDDLGDQVVTLTVDDGCGNTSTCSGTIEIVDSSQPVCVSQDITVSLDANGEYELDAAEVDGGSTASCGSGITLAVDPELFDCSDIGDNVVTLTVTASGGATDDCTATVTIEDNTPPVIVCPADMTFPCETDLTNFDQFGDATATDNCDMSMIIFDDNTVTVNACNVGTVERVFTVTDDFGNSAQCTQIVTISGPANPLLESDITWPTTPLDIDDCVPDPNNIDSGMPSVDTANLDCFNISITFSDNISGNTQCDGTIIRTWTVTDSCQAPDGVFEFVQVININDDIGPDLSGPTDMVIILPPGNTTCDTFLNLGASVSDCVSGFTVVNDSPFADNNNSEDASGTYPVGETEITITATDLCGNTSTHFYVVNVVDTTAFLFDCAKIIDNIGPSGTVVVDTSQAQAVIDFGDCMSTDYILSFSNTTPFKDTIVATCSDVGIANYTIYLWTGNVLLDSCTNLFQIVDGGGFCTTPLFGTVIGGLETPDNRMIGGVDVALVGSPFENIITGENGEYAFPTMEFGGSYRVAPQKDYDYLNGVSTLDLIAIQKHILGVKQIDSPYKLIAADIDRSGNITSTDLLELRKLILGVYDKFPNNTSWRLIDKSHKFIDPQDPFANAIPEVYEIDEFTQSMIIDFVGVKVGDINDSAIANADESEVINRSSRKFKYELQDNRLNAGDIVELTFEAKDFQNILGIQNTFRVDRTYAEILDVNTVAEVIAPVHFNTLAMKEGIVNISWNGSFDSEQHGNELFSIQIKLLRDAWVSDLIEIDDRVLRSEAYFDDNSIAPVGIEFRTSIEDVREVSLYQNTPNPWIDQTEITFYTPTADNYTINVYDVNGRLLYKTEGVSVVGMNNTLLENTIFENGGLMYYELIVSDVRLVNKMLLVK